MPNIHMTDFNVLSSLENSQDQSKYESLLEDNKVQIVMIKATFTTHT